MYPSNSMLTGGIEVDEKQYELASNGQAVNRTIPYPSDHLGI